MFDLASALSGAVSASLAAATSSSKAPKLDADGILARLSLTAKLYAEPTPFKVDELVTPRTDGKANGAGEPHVVIEILDGSHDDPLPGVTGEPCSWSPPIVLREPSAKADATSSPQYGQVLDMRIATQVAGKFAAYVVESQDFEAWTPAHEEAWRTKLAAAAAAPQPLTLTEAVAALRDRAAGKEVKAEWKAGDTVEIVPDPKGSHAPMSIEGMRVGVVQRVDPADGTTNVLYHSAETGKIGSTWLRNADLRKWGPKPAPIAIQASEPASA